MPSKAHFSVYSGADILPVINVPGKGPVAVGEIQTVTYSIHRELRPGRVLGLSRVRGFARGPRTVAGTIVFTVFDKHLVRRLAPEVAPGILFDEMPPFNIVVAFKNEYGQRSQLVITGVRVSDEGQVMSIEDLLTENTVTYIAEDVIPLSSERDLVGLVRELEPARLLPERRSEPDSVIRSRLEVQVQAGGMPLPGAKVLVKDRSGKELARGFSDGFGAVALEVPMEGDVVVTAYHQGRELSVPAVVNASVPAGVTISFPYVPDSVRVSGRVIVAGGAAGVPGASVVLTVSQVSYPGVCGSDGTFSIAVPKGRLTAVSVSAPGYSSMSVPPPGGERDLTIDVDLGVFAISPADAGAGLRGQVVCAATGEPIPGAEVEVVFAGGSSFRTAASSDGRWSLSGVPASGLERVTYSAFMHRAASVAYDPSRLLSGAHNLGQVRLEPLGTRSEAVKRDLTLLGFSGLVVDASSRRPIPHALVTAVFERASGGELRISTETGESGEYSLLDLPYPTQARLLRVEFSAEGYFPASLTGVRYMGRADVALRPLEG